MYEYEASLEISIYQPIYICCVVAENKKKAREKAIEELKAMLEEEGIKFNFEQDLSKYLYLDNWGRVKN